MKTIKKEKGISLVALIVTIVVLLILAVVGIGAIQNSDLIGFTGEATNIYNSNVEKEEGTLSEYGSYIEYGEVLTEEDLADIDIMKRYIMGAEGKGRSGLEIANVDMSTLQIISFKDDTSTEGIDESEAIPLFTAYGENNLQSIAYFKYNDKAYKVLLNPSTFLTESIELIYKPAGREGTPVEYDSNGDGDKEDWVIITDRGGKVEIVSAGVMGNLTLGGSDTSVGSVTKDLDGDLTIGDSGDRAIASYNNAITTINNYCKSLVTAKTNDGVRSIGGTNNKAKAYSSTNYDNWGKDIKVDVASGDTQFELDVVKLAYHGKLANSSEYWLASRLVSELSSYVYFYVRYVNEGMLGGYILWYVGSDGYVSNYYPSRGVRPVVINPSGI